MAKPRIGETRYVAGLDNHRHPVTIASHEVLNHRAFYRVEEIPGALFLVQSLWLDEWSPKG